MMTKKDIQCYRTNYDKKGWKKFAESNGVCLTLPLGVLDAVDALCSEIERLNKWKRIAPIIPTKWRDRKKK